MSDVLIEQDLRETIALAPKRDYWAVSVEVRDGTVHLSGQVPSYSKLVDLQLLAAETPGVRGVINDTIVEPDGYVSNILVLE
jgi:osmotically-inducible protein OsmY